MSIEDSDDRRRDFHNRLRILMSIDRYDFEGFAEVDEATDAEWVSFRDNPWRWFILAPDHRTEHIWALCEERSAPKPYEPKPPCEVCHDDWTQVPEGAGTCPMCGLSDLPF